VGICRRLGLDRRIQQTTRKLRLEVEVQKISYNLFRVFKQA
jgi:hypothetical protein